MDDDLYDDRYFDVYVPLDPATSTTTDTFVTVSTATDTVVTVSTSTDSGPAVSAPTDGAP